MSGIAKGIGKVFRRAVKAVSRVAPAVLAAGALFFTAGSALGITSNWADAVSGVVEQLGAGSTVTSVLSSAVTAAGYGALAGGGIGALKGDALGGAQLGALGGAVSGAVGGALDVPPSAEATGGGEAPSATAYDMRPNAAEGAPLPTDAAAGADNSFLRVNSGGAGSAYANGSETLAGGAGSDAVRPTLPNGQTMPPLPGLKPPAPEEPGFLDKLFGEGNWLERNGRLVGGVVEGLGRGLLSGSNAEDYAKLREKEAQIIAQNYSGLGRGLLAGSASPAPPGGQSAVQPFSAPAPSDGEYVFDPSRRRYVYVPYRKA